MKGLKETIETCIKQPYDEDKPLFPRMRIKNLTIGNTWPSIDNGKEWYNISYQYKNNELNTGGHGQISIVSPPDFPLLDYKIQVYGPALKSGIKQNYFDNIDELKPYLAQLLTDIKEENGI
ncbi:hypothetical protein C0585_04200 [Candidatus Woesearchaeota archaeon]|nr:MAG: hypothetical protein C0585_04200 [Candidatus Woesearchaeota archaeon]